MLYAQDLHVLEDQGAAYACEIKEDTPVEPVAPVEPLSPGEPTEIQKGVT